MREADSALTNGCDHDCHKDNLCNIVRSEFGDEGRCNELKEAYDQSIGQGGSTVSG